MIWHLNYNLYKEHYVKYYEQHKQRGSWRSMGSGREEVLWHLFNIDDVAQPVIKDLRLEDLHIKPRFRYSIPGTDQQTHIDEDEVIGINFNCYEEPICLVMEGKTHYYESAILDVGKHLHSIPAVTHPRLIFKLTIRAPIEIVLERCRLSGYLE